VAEVQEALSGAGNRRFVTVITSEGSGMACTHSVEANASRAAVMKQSILSRFGKAGGAVVVALVVVAAIGG
jgi:hypothetical protein